MVECDAITKKWGNSLGVTLPKDIVQKANLKENETIHIIIVKRNDVFKRTFGMLKGKIKEDTQTIKNKLRKELYND